MKKINRLHKAGMLKGKSFNSMELFYQNFLLLEKHLEENGDIKGKKVLCQLEENFNNFMEEVRMEFYDIGKICNED